MTANCRNNVGSWPAREVRQLTGRGFAYYSIKDQAMVAAAEYRLMLWNGESKGTLNSVINMIRQNKRVMVYLAPKKVFQNLRSADDISESLRKCDPASRSGSSESLESNGCTGRHSDRRKASHHLELSVLAVCQFRAWSQGASHPEDAQHRGPTLQTPGLLATWS
jgi:hypothetical protein